MAVVVITPPAEQPVSLEEAKAHLRYDFDDKDDLIEALISTATAWLDGPGGWLGRALVTQTLEWRADAFPLSGKGIALPYPPIVSLTSVTYADTAGADQVLAVDQYRVAGGVVAPAYGQTWPDYRAQGETVRIRFVAGYGAAAAVPTPIKHAIKMLVAQWFATAEPVAEGAHGELPFTVSNLLRPYRVFR